MLNFKKLQEAEAHGQGTDKSSQMRRREGYDGPRCLSITEADGQPRIGGEHFNLRDAYRRHKKETGAREHPRGKPVMHMIVGVSPDWVREGGDLHDPDNPHNRQLLKAARTWAEQTFGGCFAVRMDIDEEGGGIIDVFCAPVREMRLGGRRKKDGTPGGKFRKVISPNVALKENAVRCGRNKFQGFHASQDSWAGFAQEHLDERLERGKPAKDTRRKHVSPEGYRQALKEQQEADQQLADTRTQVDQATTVRIEADRLAEQAEQELRTEQDTLDETRIQLAGAQVERDDAVSQRDEARLDRLRAVSERDEARDERNAAIQELREADEARRTAQAQLAEAQAQAKQLQVTITQMQAVRDQVEADRHEAAEAATLARRAKVQAVAERKAAEQARMAAERHKDEAAERLDQVKRWQAAREYKAVVKRNDRLRGLVVGLYEDVSLIRSRSITVAELLNVSRPDHRTALEKLGEAIQRAVKRLNPFRKMIDRIRKVRRSPAC